MVEREDEHFTQQANVVGRPSMGMGAGVPSDVSGDAQEQRCHYPEGVAEGTREGRGEGVEAPLNAVRQEAGKRSFHQNLEKHKNERGKGKTVEKDFWIEVPRAAVGGDMEEVLKIGSKAADDEGGPRESGASQG